MRVTRYPDSKYTSLVLHAHDATWKEGIFGWPSLYNDGPKIFSLLKAVNLLNEIVVVHCQGYQASLDLFSQKFKGKSEFQKTALENKPSPSITVPLAPFQYHNLEPGYSREELQMIRDKEGIQKGQL